VSARCAATRAVDTSLFAPSRPHIAAQVCAMAGPQSPPVDSDEVLSGVQALAVGLLYGPVVQFAQPAAAQQGVASIVAMPPQLPLSVDTVFHYPRDAVLPDSLGHFCFAPVLKLHEPSELSFCLTDSTGTEQYGVSVQILSPHGSSPDKRKHRPLALFMLSGRPIYAAMSRVLHQLLPIVQTVSCAHTLRRAPSSIPLRTPSSACACSDALLAPLPMRAPLQWPRRLSFRTKLP
jgi:hypothetical protein